MGCVCAGAFSDAAAGPDRRATGGAAAQQPISQAPGLSQVAQAVKYMWQGWK